MPLTCMLTPDCLVKHTDYSSSTPQKSPPQQEKAKEAPLTHNPIFVVLNLNGE